MKQIEKLITEQRNSETMCLDEWSTIEIIKKMNEEDYNVVDAIGKELISIEKVIQKSIQTIQNGGRIIYVGAGTSGRIGNLDAVECPPTFSFDPNRYIGVLAGQNHKTYKKEEAEDCEQLGKNDLIELELTNKDFVIGLSASGRTPYVIGCLKYASDIHALTATIACNKNADISKYSQYPIEINCGPEILTGSSRLKAGTAQKMVCNMISTSTMIGLGKVYENLMVDLEVSNEKLLQRWFNIVQTATKCSYNEAVAIYETSHHNAKAAICMLLLNLTYDKAIHCLKSNHGNIKKTLKEHNVIK